MIGLLIVLLMAAWALRMRGIEWPLLHPDEYKITSWATWMEEHTKTLHPAYPGGYFHLVKPLLVIKNAILDGGEAWQSFLGHGDLVTRAEVDQTFLLRKINVGFALLTILLFYGLAFRVTRNRVAALAAAAFLGLSCLHVEHTHYAETDIAMLFTLSLALYVWARVYDTGRIGWFWMAALLTGLAIGTKYTNLLLVSNLIAGIVVCLKEGSEAKRGRRLAGLILAGVLLLAAGWLYTNRHVLEGKEYWSSLQKACQSTYAERSGILGQSTGDPYATLRSNWNTLTENLEDINSVWLAFTLLGAVLSFLPRYRRFGLVTWFPFGLYLFYFLKLAPWVRGQEFLVFFPFAAVCIAIGVKESLDWAIRKKHGALISAGVVALLMAACAQSGVLSLRCSSLFAMPEARVEALRWLYEHAPLLKRVGEEDYTVPACRLFDSAVSIGQIEWVTPEKRTQSQMDYLLRNVSSTGRGTVDPRTHDLYPDYAANLAGFQKEARRLCAWGPHEARFDFVGHQIEWWEAKPVTPALTLSSPLFRPVLVEKLPCVTVPFNESGVGSGAGLFVDTECRHLVVGRRDNIRHTLYVVLQTEERGADVVVNGMGDRHNVHLEPYDVAVVPVRRPWFIPRGAEYDIISIKARPETHVRYFPCYAQVALDARDVAMMLFQKGYADRALQWLAREPAPAGGEWLRYACAVEQKEWVLADSLESAARRKLGELEAARALSHGRMVLNGCTGSGFQEHSRLRLPLPDTGRDGVHLVLTPILLRLEKAEDEKEFTYRFPLPVRLAPGSYTIRGLMTPRPPAELTRPWTITVGDSLRKGCGPVVLESGKPSEFIWRINVEREQNVALVVASLQHGGAIDLSGVEIRWNEDGLLRPEIKALYKALMVHAVYRGDASGLSTLMKQARVAIAEDEGWSCLEQRGLSQAGSGKKGIGVFYPWVKLVSAEAIDGSTLRLNLEILKDNPPPLRVFAYRKAITGPKKFKDIPLQAQRLMKGDVVTLELARPAKTSLQEISIRLMADEEWVFAPLHVEGTRDGRLWLR